MRTAICLWLYSKQQNVNSESDIVHMIQGTIGYEVAWLIRVAMEHRWTARSLDVW
jgi:hypothetical protein